jgi:hypothetical protein
MLPKLLLTTYLAGAIEHNPIVMDKQPETWKDKFERELAHPLFGIYDPVKREPQKTGQNCQKANEHFKILKTEGRMEEFDNEFRMIWWGQINPGTDKLSIIQAIRNDFRLRGNTRADFEEWADYQSVIRSDFICAYLTRDTKTVGTHKEIHTAYLLNIPVFLIMPDENIIGINSTLLNEVRDSGGKVFFGESAIDDCINYIKTTYKIWENR